MSEYVPRDATIPSMLHYWSRKDPQNPAFIFVGSSGHRTVISRGQLFDLSGRMAARLKAHGLRKGDVVSNMLLNSPERLITEFGIQMAGGVSQTDIGYRQDGEDTINTLQIGRTRFIVTDPFCKALADVIHTIIPSTEETAFGFLVNMQSLPNLEMILHTRNKAGEDLQEQLMKKSDHFMEKVLPDDLSIIAQTSGTTGTPKMFTHTHRAMVFASKQFSLSVGHIQSAYFNDKYMDSLLGYPFHYLYTGLTRVMRDSSQDQLLPFYDVIDMEHCELAILSVADIHELKQARSKNNESKLKTVLTSGQPVRRAIVEESKSFCKTLICLYGLSETLGISLIHFGKEEEYNDFCVGYPAPDRKVKIIDDDGKEVQHDQKGEVCVQGPCITEGYMTSGSTLDRSAYTEDGWFKTGDIGYLDSNGKLFVEGRGSDAIMHGNEILYPYWLEKLARDCPAVDDIVIVPVKDPVLHHGICACVKAVRGSEDAITDVKLFLATQFLSVPGQEWEIMPQYFLLFDSFPVNRNGKIDRRELTRLSEVILKK